MKHTQSDVTHFAKSTSSRKCLFPALSMFFDFSVPPDVHPKVQQDCTGTRESFFF